MAGHDARFLRCYALYLAGEKRKDEEVTEQGSSTVRPLLLCVHPLSLSPLTALPSTLQNRGVGVLNKELPQLEAELGPLFEKVRRVANATSSLR